MAQLRLGQPLYLVDENLSYLYANVFRAVGFNMTSVIEAFRRRGVKDEEIIFWLGKQGGHRAVWITQDIEAAKTHAKLIIGSSISILWIRSRKKQELTGLEELRLLTLVIEYVTHLISTSNAPLYFWASLVGSRRARFDKLVSPLTSRKLEFKRLPIPPSY